jgi:hypothetical protein
LKPVFEKPVHTLVRPHKLYKITNHSENLTIDLYVKCNLEPKTECVSNFHKKNEQIVSKLWTRDSEHPNKIPKKRESSRFLTN